MYTKSKVNVDMRDVDNDEVMVATYHEIDTSVDIHSAFSDLVLSLTLEQAFSLLIDLRAIFREIPLPIKERG